MADSSFDAIRVVLEVLGVLCREVSEPWTGNLLQRARRLFKLKLDVDHHICASSSLKRQMGRQVAELDRDWMFFRMLFECIHKWSGAGKNLEQEAEAEAAESESLVLKIESVAEEIARDLIDACENKDLYKSGKRLGILNSDSPSAKRLAILLSDCQEKTEVLKAKAEEILEKLSNCCPLDQVRSSADNLFWTEFLDLVLENLRYIKETMDSRSALAPVDTHTNSLRKRVNAFCNELELFKEYIDEVNEVLTDSKFNLPSDFHDVIIEGFFARVASVVIRIAYQSCNYWFTVEDPMMARNKLNGLVDLQHEIDPANQVFLEFNLRFLKALHDKLSLHNLATDTYPFPLENAFCFSLVGRRVDNDFEKQLRSLVKSVISMELDDSLENVQSLFAETNAVLVEVASFFGPSRNGNEIYPPRCSELLTKICLLNAEHFLEEKLNDCTFSTPSGTHQTQTAQLTEVLEGLRLSSEDLPIEHKQYGVQSLALIRDVAKEVASLSQSFHAGNITKSMVKNSLRRLLLMLVIFKAESFCMQLLKCNGSLMACEKDQVETLLEQLKVFTLIVTNQLMENAKYVEIIFTQIEAFARRITFLSYPFLPNKIIEQMITKTTLSFSKLFDKVQHIKAKLKEISPQFPLFTFPKTYQLGFIDFLVRNLGELLKYDPKSIEPVKHCIKEVQLHLKSFLMKVSDLDMENPELKVLGDRIIDVAYKVDYVIHLIEVDAHWQHFFWFYNFLEELRTIDKQSSNIQVSSSNTGVRNVNNVTQVSGNSVSRDSTAAINEVVVDLKDQEEVIIGQLTRGSSKRGVVSIVGMPGIGKTTLARKVYNSQQIKYHFHRLAWCTVSQVYEKRELLLEIISGIHGLTGEIHHMSDADLESNLRRFLLKNKYLIVMDDVWDIGAWNHLQMSFPDDHNGSRILITSRLYDVALEIEPNSVPHSLRPFSNAESWNLLEKKIFLGETCPVEFLLVGKEIAQQCKGLPLAVVAIAGLLKRTEKRQDWWKKIAESLSSLLINDPEAQCMKILELSYKHLPEYLKACFLYLGAFIDDKDIPVSKLLRFWLAEGFVGKAESRSLEDVAEDYLMDLINRSLVIISKKRSNGKVKACCLHDLIRDLCQSKAKEENFLQLVTRRDEPYASLPGSDYGSEFDFDHHLDPVTFEAYRLSICLRRNHFVGSSPSGVGTHSLIFFASTDLEPRCPYDISFICQNFKYLRVLDLECINMGISFPAEIGLLVQLRYLAVCGYVHNVPESIANLWNLETFVVKGLRGTVVLPHTIWNMTRLRNLHVNKHVTFNLQDEEVGCYFQLDKLISFSCPSLSYGEYTEKILKKLPNLCKLRCIFLESWNSSKNCNQFPRLNFLTHLESLNVFYYGRAAPNPGEFILPLNLKNLTLSNFHLPWDHISVIGKLPNLEVLKLVCDAFEGKIWDMREEEFQELKFLKLDTLNIAQWNASDDHLPKLQRLVLRNCKALQEVPYDFADITSLEMIELQWCGQSAEESARKIGEATGEIKVLISHS